MPKVQIHYKLKKDAVIDTIREFKIENVTVEWWKNKAGDNTYEGDMPPVHILNEVEVLLHLLGVDGANWSLEVTGVEVEPAPTPNPDGTPSYNPTGRSFKTKVSPVRGQIEYNGICYYNEFLKIKWA
jgi:hypothetical protein